MVYRKQNHRFDKLRLYYRTSYRNNRLARKYRCTVRHCPYVTFKLKILQIFKKFLFKNPFTPKIFNIFRCKVNLFIYSIICSPPAIMAKPPSSGTRLKNISKYAILSLYPSAKKAIHHCKLIKNP